MVSQSSSSKRKQPDNSNFGGLLHPRWWGTRHKRSRSGSRSGSPPNSGASSPGHSYSSAHSNNSSRAPSLTRDAGPLLPSNNSPYTPPELSAASYNATNRAPQPMPGASVSAPNSKMKAWTGLEQALQKLSVATKIIPSLSSAVDDLASCLPIFEAAAKGRSDYEDITTSLKSMVDLLSKHFNATTSEDIRDTIEDVAKTICEEMESIKVQQSRSLLRRGLGASITEDDLIRRYRRVEQLFRQVEGEASLSTWSAVNEILVEKRLESLHPAQLARFKSTLSTEVGRRRCTKETRTKILDDSIAWSDNPSSAKVYWMNGMAGTGKTTIAYSFCERLEMGKQLAASFFCTRASPECRDAKRIIPTIAYQLARRLTPFRHSLFQQMKKDPDISTSQLSDQFSLLLRTPLLGAKDKLPNNLVIVVDALDECNDPYIVELFLDLLFRSAEELPVKFYVTSRPEPAIRNKMMPKSERVRSILYLHEIEQSLVQEDIERYLQDELASISPADNDIQELAEHAGKLFIYAATAVRYIRPPGKAINSKARLAAILAVSAESKKKLSSIDSLYAAILTAAINDEELEPEEQDQMRLVLWTAICACEPIPIDTLSALSGLNSKDGAMAALQPLRSVLHVSETDRQLVTTLHASFPDYMLSQERSGAFYCNKVAHSWHLARRCFDIMKSQLRFNICSLPSSFISNEETPKIGELIDVNISRELFYTCRFWADHLCETSPHDLDAPLYLIYEFLSQRLLFWMEVMSIKACMDVGVISIAKLSTWLGHEPVDTDTYSKLSELASDAHGFVGSYALSPASAYTPHIYLSALPLSSTSSYVRSHYLPQFRGLIKVSGAVFDRLEKAALGAWVSKSPIRSAAFLPSGDRIVLGNENGRISVQNAYDGKYLVQPFKAHKKTVTCIVISSDGMQIVSSSNDMTLSIWNAHNGSLIAGPFKGHTNRVTSVACSPATAQIASGSEDCTVSVWNPHNADTPMRRLTGHKKAVKSVAFSPDGLYLISGSADHAIRLWDISRGVLTLILQGHTAPVSCVQFALNGAFIVSGSDDSTIRIWNTTTGSLSHQPLKGHSRKITSIAVSSEGNHIVSGSFDCTICVWDVHRGELIAGPFHGHTKSVRSVGFASDGIRIISASDDKTVRIWNVHSQAQTTEKPSEVNSGYNERLVSSLDQRCIAFIDGAEFTKFHIWDLHTLAHGTIPTNAEIIALQFSPDGTHIHSLHTCSTICTWDAQTTELLDGPHRCFSRSPPEGSPRNYKDSVACSADGTRVVTYWGNKVELWHVGSNQAVAWCEFGDVPSYSYWNRSIFSQDGSRFLAERHEAGANVWSADTGAHVAGPFSVAYGSSTLSPDGTYICFWPRSRADPTLWLINVSNGERLVIPDPHTSEYNLRNLRFTADGLYLTGTLHSYFHSGGYWVWNMRDRTATSVTRQIKMMEMTHIRDLLGYSSDAWALLSHFSDKDRSHDIWRSQTHNARSANSDGWVLDSEGQPLLWVPAELRERFPTCRGVVLSTRGNLVQSVDYDGMLVGADWSKCYAASS